MNHHSQTQYSWCVTQRKLRARDADRDAAIELVEAAWADGQLTRDEYDQRVDRLLQAPTLRDLEQEIVDLQPDGVVWQPPSADMPAAEAVEYVRSPASSSTVSIGMGWPIAGILCLVVIATVTTVVVATRGSDQPDPPVVRDQPAASTSLVTPEAFVLAREALEIRADSDAVYSAVLTNDRFEVVYPVSAAGSDAAQAVWDGAWRDEQPASASGERLSLGLVNAAAVSTILSDAQRQVGNDVKLTLRFQIERRGDQRVCITASAPEGSTWTGTYDCRGQKVGR